MCRASVSVGNRICRAAFASRGRVPLVGGLFSEKTGASRVRRGIYFPEDNCCGTLLRFGSMAAIRRDLMLGQFAEPFLRGHRLRAERCRAPGTVREARRGSLRVRLRRADRAPWPDGVARLPSRLAATSPRRGRTPFGPPSSSWPGGAQQAPLREGAVAVRPWLQQGGLANGFAPPWDIGQTATA